MNSAALGPIGAPAEKRTLRRILRHLVEISAFIPKRAQR